MAQEYTITQFKVGDFQDPHGNTWCDVAFQGVSEPVKMVVKDPTKYSEGMTVYGEIKIQESKTGKSYNRFYRVQQDQQQPQSAAKKEWQPRDDSHIRAQWAIGQAMTLEVESFKTTSGFNWEQLERSAKQLYAMVDRVKESVVTDTSLKVQGVLGYEKAKEVASTLKAKASEEEFATSMAAALDGGTPIDLSDIPF